MRLLSGRVVRPMSLVPSMTHLKFFPVGPLSLPRIAPGGWRARAACAGHPSLPAWTWDDHAGVDDVREDVETRARRVTQAKAVCASCPVRDECRAEVDLRLDDGVRAGVDLRAARAGRAS